ncbi:hypothetical protein P4S73_28910 [Paraglaciecola sp. Hal342]
MRPKSSSKSEKKKVDDTQESAIIHENQQLPSSANAKRVSSKFKLKGLVNNVQKTTNYVYFRYKLHGQRELLHRYAKEQIVPTSHSSVPGYKLLTGDYFGKVYPVGTHLTSAGYPVRVKIKL